MARIIVKQSLALQETESTKPIQIYEFDHRKKDGSKGEAEVPDEALIQYIEKSGEKNIKTRGWEHAFEIIKFSEKENNKKHKYYLKGQEPKLTTVPRDTKSAQKKLDAKKESVKGRISAEDILLMTLGEARDEIDVRCDNKDIDFLLEIKELLTETPDEDIEEYITPLISDLKKENKVGNIKFTKVNLIEQGPS